MSQAYAHPNTHLLTRTKFLMEQKEQKQLLPLTRQKRPIYKYPPGVSITIWVICLIALTGRPTENSKLTVKESVKRWVLRSHWPVWQLKPPCPDSHPDVDHSRGGRASKPSAALPACYVVATSSPSSLSTIDLYKNHKLSSNSFCVALSTLHRHFIKSNH